MNIPNFMCKFITKNRSSSPIIYKSNEITYLPVSRKTERLFTDVLNEWLKYHSNEIIESTAYRYDTQCRYLSKYFANIMLKDIRTIMINDFVVNMKKEGFSNSAIVNYCKVISLCFKYAITMEYISENPVDNACIPKIPRHTEIYPYSVEEVMKLLEVDYLQWVKDAIMIAFHTGMRRGEIFALKWTDIDFDNQFIMVQRALSSASSKIVIKTTKTACGIRRIDIDKYLTSFLRDMKCNSNSEYVFPAAPNGRYDFRVPYNIAAHIKKMCEIAGIVPRNFHAFRHTHATVLLAYGIHPKIVQERLGHSDILITMETYSHVLPTIQMEAVKVFEQVCDQNHKDDGATIETVFNNIMGLSNYICYYDNDVMPIAVTISA
ncbi:MAG: site-specific integrase [Clostridiales bacterium]|nr:site-specific integrase [Clostridiales bacterium]